MIELIELVLNEHPCLGGIDKKEKPADLVILKPPVEEFGTLTLGREL
jgi:hypothetical protein